MLNKNTGIPLKTVAEMRDRLKLSSSNSEIIVHPNAPHAFFADYRDPEAHFGWQRLQAWFKDYGV